MAEISSIKATPTAAMDATHPLWVKEWEEGAGEATIRRHSKENKSNDNRSMEGIVLYCSWFCPFAQRAWIAAEEVGVPYQYIEVNPYRVDPKEAGGYTKQSLSLSEKQAMMPDFMETSPRGLVPAILDHGGGQHIWESSVVVEYLDQVYSGNKQTPSPLMTPFPESRALIRIYVDHCTSRIQKSYYTFLMAQTTESQEKAKQEFFRECRTLACAMAPLGCDLEPTPASILQATKTAMNEEEEKAGIIQRVDVGSLSKVSLEALMNRLKLSPGPFFLGAQFSAVDVALAPFWQRILWVGSYYRNLVLPQDAAFERLDMWWQAVSKRPSVANTLVGKERLISSYRQYAVNVATSDLANTMKSSLETEGSDSNKKQKKDP